MKISITILFYSICLLVSSQDNIRFAKRYLAPFYQYEYNNVLATDSCYWISGWGTDTIKPNYWTAVIAKFDLNGNLLLKKELRANITDFGWPEGIYYHSNKIYTLYLQPYDSAKLVTYDILKDSLYVFRSFGPMEDSQYLFTPYLFLNNQGEIFVTWSSNINSGKKFKMEVYLIKLDSLGNELLNKRITFNDRWFILRGIKESKDSNIIIHGFLSLEYYQKNNDESKRDYILVLNNKGDSLTSITYRYSMNSGIRDLIQIEDNSYICATTILSHKGSITGLPAIIRMDARGRLKWSIIPDSAFLSDYWFSTSGSIVKLEKINLNNYTALGNMELKDEVNPSRGSGNVRIVMLNFDTLGKVNWQRIYSMDSANNVFHAFDFKRTMDGGYIICGSGDSITPAITLVNAAILIKTDSFGCIVPDCHKFVNVDDVVKGKHKAFEIYPNPIAGNRFYVLSRISSAQNYRVLFINIMGQIVHSTSIQAQAGMQYILSRPANIPSGEYVIQIVGKEFIQTEKIIFE
ncbi:MAG: T9SS type A sorting domain-containing protein [Saprospiraceae bacterium]|nr:T9SS type A sorting domain-containing protein [Saprospiraceae bacterium]